MVWIAGDQGMMNLGFLDNQGDEYYSLFFVFVIRRLLGFLGGQCGEL